MGTQTIKVADWMQTPEYQARFAAAVETRDKADFECFQVLSRMADEEMLNEQALLKGIKWDTYYQENPTEAKEMADHHAAEVKRVLKLRRDADQEFGDCIRNIPKREG